MIWLEKRPSRESEKSMGVDRVMAKEERMSGA